MLLLGHVGITVGAAKLLRELHARRSLPGQRAPRTQMAEVTAPATSNPSNSSSLSSRVSVSLKSIDYRLVIAGALLPDIIDKPIGTAFFNNGRIFGHSLLLAIILLGIGVLLYRGKGRTGMLVLALGSTGHLILDQMWQNSHTLFWPFGGWSFPALAPGAWFFSLANWVHILTTNYYVLAGEIIGGLVMLWLLISLIAKHSLGDFVQKGTIR